MRVHIQNPTGEDTFAITEAQWRAALERGGGPVGLDATFANDAAGFESGVRDAEVLITWNRELVARKATLRTLAPRLSVIGLTSAGLDPLAPFDWVPDGVTLVNNSGTHADKAGEFGIMAILMLEVRFPALVAQQQKGEWRPLFSSTLEGKTLLVIGPGSLGGAVAQKARGFGMRVIGVRHGSAPHPDCDETYRFTELDRVLPQAEYLLLTCPLTPETRHILNRDRIGLLPNGARLINMARGAVWDQDAVCDALDSGALDGAITDVAVPEPLPPDHRLWRTRNMLVTPHICCDDKARYNDRTLDVVLLNLRERAAGRPMPNRVDPQTGY
ncbi:D-2-hydroxyacid dehydrogenase [Roseomonas sp. CCTCC AB2023176]|uniref:D-2-hydroxyacid dehydrogenase n=1 Tax=Roseomonas sp. CCTCC AB2023176 TaxID=3342640 RepID=UPI0035DD055F